MADFNISGVEPSGSAATVGILNIQNQAICQEFNVMFKEIIKHNIWVSSRNGCKPRIC
jgi:hypothetical protein